jgi:tRNA A-37 threonylcarbamoyl transferase component Bud32
LPSNDCFTDPVVFRTVSENKTFKTLASIDEGAMVVDEKELQEKQDNQTTCPGQEEIPSLTIRSNLSVNRFYLVFACYLTLSIVTGLVFNFSVEDCAELIGNVSIGALIGYGLCNLLRKLPVKLVGASNLTFSSRGVEPHQQSDSPGEQPIPWSKLRFVGLGSTAWSSFSKQGRVQQRVVLNFGDSPECYVNLTALSEPDRQHFFRILSRNVPQRLLSPEVLFMQVHNLYGGNPSIESFTQIWAEEFDKKFELANHVSLPAGQACGNNRYTIEMTIATRISSSTYLASDRDSNRVVLKELVVPVNADEVLQDKVIEQFDREASILASLSHKSIVSVKDHFVENGRSYLVMDCVSGNNIRHYVRQHGSLKQRRVVLIARQLAEVLCYMHTQEPPIIHRDLTPDNIVYSDDTDLLKVIDFGAANIYQSRGTGTLIGKQGYMPPEQFKGKATPASDIYALGSTLLFMLSGADPPGMGRMPDSELQVDLELHRVIQACLQFDQEGRPSAAELVEQLKVISERLKEDA